MTHILAIKNIGLSYVSPEYYEVVRRVAKRTGFLDVDQFLTNRYVVRSQTELAPKVYAYYAFASLIPLLERAMKRADVDPEEILKTIIVPAETDI